MLRHAATVVHGWIKVRHLEVFGEEPLSLFGLGDPRLCREQRLRIAELIYPKSRCCLRVGLALQLRERVPILCCLGRSGSRCFGPARAC